MKEEKLKELAKKWAKIQELETKLNKLKEEYSKRVFKLSPEQMMELGELQTQVCKHSLKPSFEGVRQVLVCDKCGYVKSEENG